jgi:hypothetical protein
MQTFPILYDLENDKHSHSPMFVFEILWAGGLHGVEGTNDVYFGTADIENIENFTYPERYYPFLDANSISSVSHKVDPISGVSTIGGLTVKIQDYQNVVSDIIKAADNAGHGLRRQRVEIYMLFKGMDWADKIKIRTMQIQDLRLSKKGEYTLTCSDIQRNLQKTVFNPVKSTISANIAGAGGIAVVVPDNSIWYMVTNVSHGTAGFVKVNDEIMKWTSYTGTTDLNVPAAGRGMFGTSAAAHTAGDDVQEIIVLRENPITMALKVMQSSGVDSAKGTYDKYPAHWGCSLESGEEIDEAGWLTIGKELAGLADSPAVADGYQFEFVFSKGIEAKRFIEGDILKVLGGFGFVTGGGLYSVRAYSDLANADKSNAALHITENNATKWSDLHYDYGAMANELWLDYVESPKLSGKYIRTAIFNDEVSKKKWGNAKQLRYQVRGAIATAAYIESMYQRFQRVMARFSRPPLRMKIDLLPREHGIEIGDIVRVTLPVHDLLTGADIDRAFEVLSVNLKPHSGAVSIECIAQPENAAFWFNGVGDVFSVTVSPATSSIANAATQQMVVRAYDANGNQVAWPSIAWTASGDGTIDAAGLVTATGVGSIDVYATIGGINSNTAVITVTAAAGSGTVATVTVSPASAGLEVADTQLLVAQCFDSSGVEINGRTFDWASDDGSVTIPAGPSVSATATGDSIGTANITATETVSVIASPDVVVSVATLPPAEYTPPAIHDNVYKVGTQLDETDGRISGAPGGPYTIDDGATFSNNSYWFDNDVSLPVGNTMIIGGNLRLFCLGTVTINGTIDGNGRGLGGGPVPVVVGPKTWNLAGGVIMRPIYGNAGNGTGLVGKGGVGGKCMGGQPLQWYDLTTEAPGGAVTNAAGITVQIIPETKTGSTWDTVSGIPANMQGSGGGSGSGYTYEQPGIYTVTGGGKGGASGAGLLIMARGLFVSGSGLIDLRGHNGVKGARIDPYSKQLGGGGGGGGTFIGLAERTSTGLTNMVVDANRVLTAGGIGAVSDAADGAYLRRLTDGTAGGAGAFKSQVIG